MTSRDDSKISAGDSPRTCMVCAGAVNLILRDCKDYYLSMPVRVSYGRCVQCGLVQQVPIPSDVAPFYKAYPMHTRRGRLQQLARKLLKSPAYFHPRRGRAYARRRGFPPFPEHRTKLLDYGCGDGGYLESIAGPDLNLHGYEVDPNLAQRVAERSNIPVTSDREQLIRKHIGSFDVITAHFVFEHLTDLRAGFADVSNLLKPGGIFYCVVPQFDSTEARLFGRRWHGLDPPRHISFPGPSVMERLSIAAGLRLTEYHPVAFANGFAGSIATFPLGRFCMPVFLLSLPIGSVFARLFPGGARAFVFEKPETA